MSVRMRVAVLSIAALCGLACGTSGGTSQENATGGSGGSGGLGGVTSGGSSGSPGGAGLGGKAGSGGSSGAAGATWSGEVSCGAETCPREAGNFQVCCWNRATSTGSCMLEADCQEGPDIAVIQCDASVPPMNGLGGPRCCFDTLADGSASANYADGCGSSHLTPTITVTLCDALNPPPGCDCQPITLEGWLPPNYAACAF